MADTYKIKKPAPMFRRQLRLAPAHPRGDRILVREVPPETVTEGGLHMAEQAIERLFAGYIVAAGLKAQDIMYDEDDQIGDLIAYAKYAGIVEAWKHIVGPDDPKCEHDGARHHVGKPGAGFEGLGTEEERAKARARETKMERLEREDKERKWALVPGGPTENVVLQECLNCGTLIVTERVIVMNIEDILLNVDAQERLEAGLTTVVRGVTSDGQTQHVLERRTKTIKEAA